MRRSEASRVAWLGVLAALGALAVVPGGALTPARPQEFVARAYGVGAFDRIERLAFTFNVQREGKQVVRRSWSWQPATGQVEYRGPGEDGSEVSVRYLHPDQAARHPKIDQAFINDTYWLLFPMHLVRDENVEIRADGTHPLPIGEGEAPRLTVRYTGQAGYTPGDVYELYLAPSHRIAQWVFRKSGTGEPRPMTWDDHRQLGPIVVSLDHRSADGATRVWFSEVSAHAAGQRVEPQPLPQ